MSTAKKSEKTETRISRTVIDTITKHDMLSGIEHMIVGLSGGSDSMCLFDIALKIGEARDIEIHPVHVNHGIRKGTADEDQKFCEDHCRSKGAECKSFVYDCEDYAASNGLTTEEAGRELRYTAFREVIAGSGINPNKWAIALAQNSDDQVETLLMRIIRGTGTDGLAGIPYVRPDYSGAKIIRPILDISKEETIAYCRENGLEYREDETNSQDIYNRNRIRLDLIPYLQEGYNPKIGEALLRLARVAQEDKGMIDELVTNAKEEALVGGKLSRSSLLKLHPALSKRVIGSALADIGMDQDMEFVHFEACQAAIDGDNPSAKIELPGGYYLLREYELVILGRDSDFDDRDGALDTTGPSENCAKLRILTVSKEEFEKMDLPRGTYAAFDMDLIKETGINSTEDITIRTRRPGDRIKLSVGTKKLQDVMTDDKVPKRERELAQVAAYGDQVLYMVPFDGGKRRWAQDFNITEDTREVMLIVEN